MICSSITLNPKTPLQSAPQRAIETLVSRNPATFLSLTIPHPGFPSYSDFSAHLPELFPPFVPNHSHIASNNIL
jgi:hypothetical protein